ncbi:MAG: YraN family protein [Pseudomonadales bacterium]|nr:YraN family protein [Pseudomonadales bacterium]
MNSTVTGREAERTAELYLRQQGLQLVQRNYRARTGEIDLIMERGSLLAFVEVRYRGNPNYGSGADSISRSKQRKIINTAHLFLQKHCKNNDPRWNEYRFDVVSIGNEINWIPGAFTLD